MPAATANYVPMPQLCAANAGYRRQCGKQDSHVSCRLPDRPSRQPQGRQVTPGTDLIVYPVYHSAYSYAKVSVRQDVMRSGRVSRVSRPVLPIRGDSTKVDRYTDVASMRLPVVR